MNPWLLGLLVWFAIAFALLAAWLVVAETIRWRAARARRRRRRARAGNVLDVRFGEAPAGQPEGPIW